MFRQVLRFRRPLIILLLIGSAAAFLLRQRNEIGPGLNLLQRADPLWFVALVALQLLLLAVSAATYQQSLKLLGHQLSLWRLVDIHLKRHVVGAIAPLGGPASVYVFVRALAGRGISTNDALFVIAIRGGIGMIAFAMLVIPTILLSSPAPLTAIAAGVLMAFVLAIVAVLVAVGRCAALPARIESMLPRRAIEFAQRAREHGVRPRDLLPVFVLALLMNVGSAAMLYLSLRAIGQDAAVANVFSGFAIGNVLQMVAPVSQGFGLVEVTMATALQQVGIGHAPAIAATLLYRVGDLWMPLLLGLTVQLVRWVGLTGFLPRMKGAAASSHDWVARIGASALSAPTLRTGRGSFVAPRALQAALRPITLVVGSLAIASSSVSDERAGWTFAGSAVVFGAALGAAQFAPDLLLTVLSTPLSMEPLTSFMSLSHAAATQVLM